MWYRGALQVRANTVESSPATLVVPICRGVISQFYRLFPEGCSGFVHLQVYHQTRQIFPTSQGESYIGDGSEVLSDTSVNIDEPPYELELWGWSPGSSYGHYVYCEFYIEKPQVLIPIPLEALAVPLPAFEGVL